MQKKYIALIFPQFWVFYQVFRA